MKAQSAHRLPEKGLMPIRTVSSMTGVNSVTLRAWERRYDLIKPVRTPKGHRLYTMADVALIQQVTTLLDNGMSIGQVGRVLETHATDPESIPDHEPNTDLWGHYQRQLLDAITAFNDEVLNDLYTEILSLYPVDVVTSRLIMPLLQELGERWVQGSGSIAEEHFFSVFLRNKLGARFHHLRRAPQGSKLLVACLPGEHHEIGLLLFALAALDRNYAIVLLGANTPLAELPAVVDRAAIQALVLAGSTEIAAAVIHEELPQLCQTLAIPVFIGGRIADRQAADITAAGAIPLEENLNLALRRVDRRLTHY
ncbi:MAG TPA: MerR family transcriptional regulator [Verrucomicrobia bacterium]|nr:MerR family transcriptional regulator [Verrucomicrobiota bacterium]